MKNLIGIVCMALVAVFLLTGCQRPPIQENLRPQTPIMGWASWNHYKVGINEDIIKAQADAIVSSGLRDAGYSYLNIDDGFFGGRDANGNLLVHPERFPNGMKALAKYIHSKELKAGIYSDAGINTCGSYWDKDTIGVGVGLYGHERKDLSLMLKEWKYDFIKIDWCGGDWLALDEETCYTELSGLIREIRPDVVFNVCRWQFPGEWVVQMADSWRISGDIANTFESVMHIVDINANLWKYSGPGHVNDMDMLQVGRGMSYEEDKTHFSMWCMMNSPLIAGNDLTKISNETLGILTNREIIEINQDPLVYQARRLKDFGEKEIWAKPLTSTMSGKVAVALLNRSGSTGTINFKLADIGIDPKLGYTMRDLWAKKDFPVSKNEEVRVEVPAHGVVVLKVQGTSLSYNVFQYDKET
jgi:alpha-galactosidase